jgi:ubiquinone/menaquinone biosynthesis C-methylase UbiE
MYDPALYWSRRSEPNSENTNDKEKKEFHVKFLKERMLGCQKICDVGPGTGRLVESYVGKNVAFVDIHESYKDRLYKACKAHNIDHTFIKVESIAHIPYENGVFDAAVLSLVLLHVAHKDIESVLREALRVANSLIIIDVSPDYQTSASHVFTHDFHKLSKIIGCNIDVFSKDKDNHMFFTMSYA